MTQPEPKPAPHDVLAQHFPTEIADGAGYCMCGREFESSTDWATHALGRVGLDSDNAAPFGSPFPAMA